MTAGWNLPAAVCFLSISQYNDDLAIYLLSVSRFWSASCLQSAIICCTRGMPINISSAITFKPYAKQENKTKSGAPVINKHRYFFGTKFWNLQTQFIPLETDTFQSNRFFYLSLDILIGRGTQYFNQQFFSGLRISRSNKKYRHCSMVCKVWRRATFLSVTEWIFSEKMLPFHIRLMPPATIKESRMNVVVQFRPYVQRQVADDDLVEIWNGSHSFTISPLLIEKVGWRF